MRLVTLLTALLLNAAFAQSGDTTSEILRISPTSGPEGSRVEIVGRNLQEIKRVKFGDRHSTFKVLSPDKLIAIVPNRAITAEISSSTTKEQIQSPFPFVILNDPRIPHEVSYKAGYVNPDPKPPDFTSVLLWGIAISDTRIPNYASATIEISRTRLSCRINGNDIVLNDDMGQLRGGLYLRCPWFSGNHSELMPMSNDPMNHAVILNVGQRPDRIWHFWSASPRPALPPGRLEGCTAKAWVKISDGALLQMGMDYWRSPAVSYAPGNNHEAGASNWYFSSPRWQEAVFTDIGGPQF